MTDATLIEIQNQAAGIVTRDGRAFRFHAATPRFHPIDGQVFDSVLAAERAARRLLQGQNHRRRRPAAKTRLRGRSAPARRMPRQGRHEAAFAD